MAAVLKLLRQIENPSANYCVGPICVKNIPFKFHLDSRREVANVQFQRRIKGGGGGGEKEEEEI